MLMNTTFFLICLEPNFSLYKQKLKVKRKTNTDAIIHELNPLFMKMVRKNEFEDENKIPLKDLLNDLLNN